MKYNELKLHGEANFPLALYILDSMHPQYEMACHYHENLEFIYVLEGELSVTLDNDTFLMKKGDIALSNSNTLHSAIPKDCVYMCIVFDFSYFLSLPIKGLSELFEKIKCRDMLINNRFSQKDGEIYESIKNLFKIIKEKKECYRLMATGEIYRIFSLIVAGKFYKETISTSANIDDKSREKLKKVLSHMRKNFSSPLPLSHLAEIAGMSEKYFCSFFRKMTNKTPVEYLIFYRIECSAKMLSNTDISVTEAAFSCGFNDLSYFIKTFKRQMGVTPGEYRTLNS